MAKLETDVLIVGAGLSGLIAAHRLSSQGLHCTVLEAGPALKRTPSTKVLEKKIAPIDARLWPHDSCGEVDYEWLRIRAAGGRSLLWGGWCIEMDGQNERDAHELGAPWPVRATELSSYYKTLRRILNVKRGKIDVRFKAAARALELPIEPRVSALHASGGRATTALDLDLSAGGERFQIIPYAIATEVLCDDATGRVRGVAVVDPRTKKKRELRAPRVLLCAGAIETARLLLDSPGLARRAPIENVGRQLTDHLVMSYLVLSREAPPRQALSPLEESAYLPRFVNTTKANRQAGYRSGFLIELNGPFRVAGLGEENFKQLELSTADARKMSYFTLHALGEVAPDKRRHLDLEGHAHAGRPARDALGRRIPHIHWTWNPEDRRMARDMEKACARAADALSPIDGQLVPMQEEPRAGAIAHEASTCPMGVTERNSVTNRFGAVWGVEGLYLGDASVMPTALDRYPTFTSLALTLRACDRLAGARTRAR